MTRAEPRRASVGYPGGLRARWAWGGSGQGADVFALSESGGDIIDHGTLGGPDVEQYCRAEVRVEGPAGTWTARFASPIYDEPAALLWDTPALFVATYGFTTYAFDARGGSLRWHHRSGTPLIALIGSSRLAHVIVQAEIETFAIEADGTVAWRVAHSDVVTSAELVGGKLVLNSFSAQVTALDPVTGRTAG
ncbi:MAG: PQQ-binding-like beta-propeller repeat protein [Chloroflexota bacterium]